MKPNQRHGLLRNLDSRVQDSEHPNGTRNRCREELGSDSSGREHCLLVRLVRRRQKGAINSRNGTSIREQQQ